MVIQGIIKPPPEIRAVADRTASYVAKNGRAFEARIKSSAKGQTPKFAFLQTHNPFHAYYEDRIQFYENGGVDKAEEKEEDTNTTTQTAPPAQETAPAVTPPPPQPGKVTRSALDPVAKAVLTQRNRIKEIIREQQQQQQAETSTEKEATTKPPPTTLLPPPPEPLHFLHIVPPASLTLVQVETIQLVAQLTALDGKGGTFLPALTRREWNNPRYAFCQPRHGHFAYFSALVDAYRYIIATWTEPQRNSNNNSNNDTTTTTTTATTTTTTTTPLKQMAHNPQACLERAAYRAEYQRHVRATQRRTAAQATSAAALDTRHLATTATRRTGPLGDTDTAEPIRVVPTYQPKIVSASQQSTAALDTVVDPSTGQRVRVADLPEHVRIQLLDSRVWATEKQKFQDKQRDSNLLADGDMVAQNLARLAQARGGRSSEQVLDTEDEARQRLQNANRILREQALDPKTPVGPALPDTKRPSHAVLPSQPDAKRPKITEVLPPTSTSNNNNHPHPTAVYGGNTLGSVVATAADPFAMAATGGGGGTSTSTTPGTATLSEADFLASLPRPEVTLQVRVPNDPAQMAWNFYGQIVSLSVHATSTVKTVKQELSRQHLNQMPVNKVQLKHATTGIFLKDSMTLAALNIGPTATLEIKAKTRSGRK